MQTRPFSRVQEFAAALNMVLRMPMALPYEAALKQAALNHLGEYKSRGKGGKSPTRTGHAHMKAVRTARKLRNKRRA